MNWRKRVAKTFKGQLNILAFGLITDTDVRSHNDVHMQLNDKDTEDLIHGKDGKSQLNVWATPWFVRLEILNLNILLFSLVTVLIFPNRQVSYND